jgi:hypothetical protein
VETWDAVNAALARLPNRVVPTRRDLAPDDELRTRWGEETADRVRRIGEFTDGYDPDWSVGDLDAVRAEFRVRLSAEFPGLDEASVRFVDRIFAYTWK